MAEERFLSLAVHPEAEARLRLRHAISTLSVFGEAHLVGTLGEGATKLDYGVLSYDLVFVSETLDKEEVAKLLQKGKESKAGRDAAFIVLINDSPNKAVRAAETVLQGFDGCLVEPYSVDRLVEISRLAAEVRKKRREERQREAVLVLVEDIMRLTDQVAYLRQSAIGAGILTGQLKKTCGIFKTLDQDALRYYYEVMAEQMEKTLPYRGVPGNYQGASSRVKKKMLEKLAAGLDVSPKK